MAYDQHKKSALTPIANKKVLVIDDSPTVRYSANQLLQAQGCDVTLAVDGYAALALLARVTPDIIFTDITMPRLNGEQFCKLIKHHPEYQTIPVIMLTARDTDADREAGFKVGAQGYLIKPFDQLTLLGAMAEQFNRNG